MGAKVQRSESSWEQNSMERKLLVQVKVPRSKVPGNESSSERTGQSSIGTFAPGSELDREQKGCDSCTDCL